jgi:two-component system, cell cycle sensor histidine kinase PleC
MSAQADHAHRSDMSGPDRGSGPASLGVWEPQLLTLFVRYQLRVAFAMPLIALFFAVAISTWTNWLTAASWFGSCLAALIIQHYLCKVYEQTVRDGRTSPEWIGMLCASESLIAVCWAIPVFVYWMPGDQLQHTMMVSIVMAVISIRVLTAGNYMPVILCGTGLLTLATVVRCLMEESLIYVTLGTIVVIAEIFFIQLVRRLQGTAREMLIFKAEREALIGRLDGALSEAEEARVKAEAASQAKSRFLATMSHELRTPLNAILGFSEILSKEMMGPHAVPVYKSYSDDIHDSGDYLLKLINDILDLSRIEADRQELAFEPVDPCAEGRDSAELMHIQLERRKQTVRFVLPDTPLRVLGDKRAIRQIWLNLLSNASKFSPEGSVIVVETRQQPDGNVLLSVADQGPGLAEGELNSMREAFVRGSFAQKKAIDGAGLGLSIVNGLAELHEAGLVISHNEPSGLIVSVEFPSHKVLGSMRAHLVNESMRMPATQRRLIELTA